MDVLDFKVEGFTEKLLVVVGLQILASVLKHCAGGVLVVGGLVLLGVVIVVAEAILRIHLSVLVHLRGHGLVHESVRVVIRVGLWLLPGVLIIILHLAGFRF